MHVYQDFLPRLTTLQQAQNRTVYERKQVSRKYTQEHTHRSTHIRSYYNPRIDVRCKHIIIITFRVISETLLHV